MPPRSCFRAGLFPYDVGMLLDVAAVAVLLLIGNVLFRRFEPHMPLWRRFAKTALALAGTALISYYFGRTGVLIAMGIAVIALVYIHGIWLPRHGVNGWTAEPREKYYALRGWPLLPDPDEHPHGRPGGRETQ